MTTARLRKLEHIHVILKRPIDSAPNDAPTSNIDGNVFSIYKQKKQLYDYRNIYINTKSFIFIFKG